ncbi:hypothetical protein BDF14DRAFT_1878285 [Spinellus fusiger]|nr:hypothetical protein BDF14DRAFT_1878285 [Spinellus fusiger]
MQIQTMPVTHSLGPLDTHSSAFDPSAWPSSYGKARRIHLEKYFSDMLQASEPSYRKASIRRRPSCGRRVSFTADPPTVHEYESENTLQCVWNSFDMTTPSLTLIPEINDVGYESFHQAHQTPLSFKKNSQRKGQKPRKLNLKPVINTAYVPQELISSPASTVSTLSPVTPVEHPTDIDPYMESKNSTHTVGQESKNIMAGLLSGFSVFQSLSRMGSLQKKRPF